MKHENYCYAIDANSNDEEKMTPSCCQQSIDLFEIIPYEPMKSNPLNPDNISLDCIEENSNDSFNSVNPEKALKNKLKEFCLQAVNELHNSTWEQAIDFVQNLEHYYENELKLTPPH